MEVNFELWCDMKCVSILPACPGTPTPTHKFPENNRCFGNSTWSRCIARYKKAPWTSGIPPLIPLHFLSDLNSICCSEKLICERKPWPHPHPTWHVSVLCLTYVCSCRLNVTPVHTDYVEILQPFFIYQTFRFPIFSKQQNKTSGVHVHGRYAGFIKCKSGPIWSYNVCNISHLSSNPAIIWFQCRLLHDAFHKPSM